MGGLGGLSCRAGSMEGGGGGGGGVLPGRIHGEGCAPPPCEWNMISNVTLVLIINQTCLSELYQSRGRRELPFKM